MIPRGSSLQKHLGHSHHSLGHHAHHLSKKLLILFSLLGTCLWCNWITLHGLLQLFDLFSGLLYYITQARCFSRTTRPTTLSLWLWCLSSICCTWFTCIWLCCTWICTINWLLHYHLLKYHLNLPLNVLWVGLQLGECLKVKHTVWYHQIMMI